MAAAVSNAGGLGIIGPNADAMSVTTDVHETGERLRQQIRRVKSLTDKPFGVNVLSYRGDIFYFSDQCVKVILEEGIAVAAVCGAYPDRYSRQLRDARIKLLYRPVPFSNVEVAEQVGMDAFVAVDYEGGGHIGRDRIPTFVLIPQVVDAIRIPVLAGGGVVDGRGMAAAKVVGANGVYLGTRFITAIECPAHPTYKQATVDANDTSTVAFSSTAGLCRALKTPPVEHYYKMELEGAATAEELANLHRHETRPWLEGDWTATVFPAGAGAGLIKEVTSAAKIVSSIVKQADKILKGTRFRQKT